MIKWCLYLRHRSSGAYEALRESGCLVLPSQRTLRDYTYYVEATAGFLADVDRQLMQAAKLDTCKEYEKCVILLIDEMYVKEDLYFDKHKRHLIGYTDIGSINSYLEEFEKSLSGKPSETKTIANAMMTFMVQGLFTKLRFPYAQFPCRDMTGEQLYHPFWDAVGRLERMGFKVAI